jgi:hypothetical protein
MTEIGEDIINSDKLAKIMGKKIEACAMTDVEPRCSGVYVTGSQVRGWEQLYISNSRFSMAIKHIYSISISRRSKPMTQYTFSTEGATEQHLQ